MMRPGEPAAHAGPRQEPGGALRLVGTIGGSVQFVVVSVTQLFFALSAAELGVPTALIGLLIMLRAVLPLVFSLPSGSLIDRIGAARVLKIGCGATALALALMAWSPGVLVLGAGQMLIGISTLLIASSQQVLVAQGAKAARDRAITSFSTWSSVGAMAGPAIGGAIASLVNGSGLFDTGNDLPGYRAAFLFCLVLIAVYGAFVVLAVPAGAGRVETRGAAAGGRGGYLAGLRLAGLAGVQYGLVGTFLIHFLQTVWTSFFPLYLDGLGYTAFVIAVLVSVRGAAALASRAATPVLLRLTSQERILLGAGCIAAACLIVLPLLHGFAWAVFLVTAILGFATGVNMPVSTIIMVDCTPEQDRGKVMGLRLFVNRLSQVAAPVVFGTVGGAFGLGAAFASGGTVLLCALVGFGAWSRSRSRPAA